MCCLAGLACGASVPFYCSKKGIRDALGIHVALEEVRQSQGVGCAEGWMDRESATWRAGCGEAMDSGSSW